MKENIDFLNLSISKQDEYKINNRGDLEFKFINFICNYYFSLTFKNELDYIDYNFNQEDSLKIRKDLQYFRGIGDNFFYIDSYFNKKPMYQFKTLYDFDKETSKDDYKMTLNIHLTGGLIKELDEYNFYYFNLLTLNSYIANVVREDTSFALEQSGLSRKEQLDVRRTLGKYLNKIKSKVNEKTEHNNTIWVLNNNDKLRPHKAYIFSGKNITKNINLATWQKDTEKYIVNEVEELDGAIAIIKEKYTSFMNKEVNKMLKKDEVFDSKIIKFKRNIKIGSVVMGKSVDRLSYHHKKYLFK
jgi:hypothetical protein